MTTPNDESNFYEDDEPAEKIRSAFERGEKGKTRRPRDLNRLAASIVDDATRDREQGLQLAEFSNVTVDGLSTGPRLDVLRVESVTTVQVSQP